MIPGMSVSSTYRVSITEASRFVWISISDEVTGASKLSLKIIKINKKIICKLCSKCKMMILSLSSLANFNQKKSKFIDVAIFGMLLT
jgi:hypothetical protein